MSVKPGQAQPVLVGVMSLAVLVGCDSRDATTVATADVTATTAPGDPYMLGSFTTADQLIAEVRSIVAAIKDDPAARPPGGGGLPVCRVVPKLFYAAKAALAAEPATVVVFGEPDAERVVVYDSNCEPLYEGLL